MIPLAEVQALDLGGVELAAVGREQHHDLADDGRLEAGTTTADVRDAVDEQARFVGEVGVVHPATRSLALRHPLERDLEGRVLSGTFDGGGRDLSAVEVVLASVLHLKLSACVACGRFRCQLHGSLLLIKSDLTYVTYNISSLLSISRKMIYKIGL